MSGKDYFDPSSFQVSAGEHIKKSRSSAGAVRVSQKSTPVKPLEASASELSTILQATSALVGEDFFKALLQRLGKLLKVQSLFLVERSIRKPHHAELLAFWDQGNFAECFEFDIRHTPTEHVFLKKQVHYPSGIRKFFPKDELLKRLKGEAYFALPLCDSSSRVLGHIALVHNQPFSSAFPLTSLLNVFESRLSSELERKRMEDSLRKQLEFEQLIAQLSKQFLLLNSDQFDSGIHDVLRRIGEFIGVDRSYIFQFYQHGRMTDETHEWCADGVSPFMKEFQNISVDDFPWAVGQLQRGEVLYISRVDELPVEAEKEKQVFQDHFIKSILAVPMISRGRVIGFLGFDAVKEEKLWSQESIQLIRMVGEMIMNALERRRIDVALRESYDVLDRRVHEKTNELMNMNKLLKEEIAERKAFERRLKAGSVELEAATKALEKEVVKRKEVDRIKSDFVSFVSHQLRTPITAIRWYADALLRFNPSSKRGDENYLQDIYNLSQHMSYLIDTLLDVSQIEMGAFVSRAEPTVLPRVTENILRQLAPQIQMKKLQVEKHYPNEFPAVTVDARSVEIILQNLLSNAIKYTPKKGKIGLGFSLEKDRLILSVSDTGYGVPKEDKDKIFQKLFRAENVRKKDIEGVGLGLYMVRMLLDQIGGEIWFESEKGRGTVFHVAIPLAKIKVPSV